MIENKQAEFHAQIVQDLSNSIQLHDAQKMIAKSIFIDGIKRVFVQCGRKFGKMLRLETKILTPNGFTTMRDVSVGDYVINRNGKPTRVTYKSPIHTDDKCYKVTMSDGTQMFAGKSHQWIVKSKLDRKSIDRFGWSWAGRGERVLTTEEISKDITYAKEYNYSIDCCKPVEFTGADLPIDPYVFGLWLGDGHTSGGGFTTADIEIIERIENAGFIVNKSADKYGYYIRGLSPKLRKLGALGNKHIPDIYKFSKIEDRVALIQGLMDSDGCGNKNGSIEFSSTIKSLVDDARFILCSLGIKMAGVNSRIPKCMYKGSMSEGKRSYRISFHASELFNPFRLRRKAERVVIKKKPSRLFITKCELIDNEPMACISVESDCESYLITDSCIVTHNTSIIPYVAYRYCMTFPGSCIFIIAPFFNQAKELLWADRRMTHFLPDDIAKKHGIKLNNTELRVMFGNGSYIKLLGADNPEAGRGVNPDMIIFDESKDISSTYFENFEPNLAAKNGTLLMVGTPPDNDQNLFCKISKEIKNDPDGKFFTFPSWTNPHLSKDWFKKQKQRLIDRGEYDVWQREYEAKLVFGGHNAIFPMFKRSRHVIKYESILAEIKRYPKDYEYYYGFDPGSSSCFAGMSMVLNKKTKRVIFLDEIYEKRTLETSTGKIYPIAKTQMDIVQPFEDKWMVVYDHAALWFANEVSSQFDRNIMPCEKDVKTKNDKISTIKDMMNYDFLCMTDRCQNFAMEIENYIMDERGKTDKCADHLLDVARYLLNASNYDFTPDMTLPKEEERRYYTPESERKDLDDPVYGMFEWMYED